MLLRVPASTESTVQALIGVEAVALVVVVVVVGAAGWGGRRALPPTPFLLSLPPPPCRVLPGAADFTLSIEWCFFGPSVVLYGCR